MYSLVLMAALTAGAETPNFCWGCHCGCGCWGCHCGGWGCHGCHGCCGCGCWGCHGCSGCCGCYGCYGCCGCGGCYSCCGCCGCGCYGYSNGGGAIYTTPGTTTVPATTEPEKLPPPKKNTDSQARLVIEVPADAKLYIDNTLMKATSDKRSFNTPQLRPGQMYFYDLKAEVTRDGKTYAETKRVTLKAGDTIRASFADLTDREPAAVASVEK